MLRTLRLKKFTAFSDETFEFAPGLNVFVGENATGKTHLLKLAYTAIYVSGQGRKDSGSDNPTKSHVQTAIAKKLLGVFKPDALGRLARREKRGRTRAEVACKFIPPRHDLRFSFHTSSSSEVGADKLPAAWLDRKPVYLPTRELLTIYPGFVPLYETTHLSFDETWRDTCLLLGAPLARGPREKRIRELLAPLEEAMNGKVELDDTGRFYLNVAGVTMEMHLVAEGFRKLAMLTRLIATGSLAEKSYLFWDEPEANLNPKLVKTVARTILGLCQSGIQVFIATHSLFLMRELDILVRMPEFRGTQTRFFGLHAGADGVTVQQGPSIDDIGEITSLQQELTQSDMCDVEDV